MSRQSGFVFAVLVTCAAVPAGTAAAQYSSGPPPVYRETSPPNYRGLPPSWMVDEDDDPRLAPPGGAQQGYGAQPQQGYGAPGQQAPAQGYYQSNQAPQGYYPSNQPYQPQQGQQQPVVRGPADGDVVRPPGDVGARPAAPGSGTNVAALPPEDQPETGEPKALDPKYKKQLVDYRSTEPAGTIIIDTANKFLYLTLGSGKALRYGIGVGREGFTWAGAERVSRMAEWPDWHPPAEMIERQPYLPRMMAGGPGNPLGARALYLGKTLYRIHGTNQPSTIGTNVSSGCIRLLNEDIEDLYSRVQVGTRVVVLPNAQPAVPSAQAPASAPVQVGSNGPTGSIRSAPLPAIR
jgi:lipoprotein-anchoring transpeptidase ErfK/SrfK